MLRDRAFQIGSTAALDVQEQTAYGQALVEQVRQQAEKAEETLMFEEIIGEEPLDLFEDDDELDIEPEARERAFCIDFGLPNRPVPLWA